MAKKTRKTKAKSVMHTDIKDLEITQALRRVGNVRVTEWEIDELLPTVKSIAAKEVDVLNFFKRTANLRVNDWELGGFLPGDPEPPAKKQAPTPQQSERCIRKLADFLGFVTRCLIESNEIPTLKVSTPSPSEIRFRLVLNHRDAAALIGHGGHTAAAIRNIMKDAGSRSQFFVDLKILTREEEQQIMQTQSSREDWRTIELTVVPIPTQAHS